MGNHGAKEKQSKQVNEKNEKDFQSIQEREENMKKMQENEKKILKEKEEALKEKEEALKKKEEALKKKEADLKKKEADLKDEKEQTLKEKEADLKKKEETMKNEKEKALKEKEEALNKKEADLKKKEADLKDEKEKALKEKEEALKKVEEANKTIEKYKDYENLSEKSHQNLKKTKQFETGNLANKIRKDVDNYIKTLSQEEKKKIEEIQQYLTNYNKNYKFQENKMKSPFFYKFGDEIDNIEFITFMKQGLSTLYSNKEDIYKNVFEFFKDIEEEIKNFIYIPLLNNNTLCEFKKHLYLGALTSQMKEEGYNEIINYIFYTDDYFNEKNFESIEFNMDRRKTFINLFPEYSENYTFKLNLENIHDYIFSETVIEAYYETCKDIFGEDANFVSKENIKTALNSIYDKIVKKNIRFVKLEKNYFGVTIYSKKILISNVFIKNIKEFRNPEAKVTFLGGLVKTILHEIMHCLTNCLPSYHGYVGLSNPFIRTFKKNIKIYKYVHGNIIYKENNESLNDILKKEIKNYNFIEDSGRLFESKLFENNPGYKMNYFTSEYFLNINNLNQSLKDFKENLNKFENQIIKNEELKSLIDRTSFSFKSHNKSFYLGRCLLDPRRSNFID